MIPKRHYLGKNSNVCRCGQIVEYERCKKKVLWLRNLILQSQNSDNMTTLTMMMVPVIVMMMMAGRVESITKFERRREAKNDLLSTHCIERSACMRQGGNMMGWVSYSDTTNITCTCIIILPTLYLSTILFQLPGHWVSVPSSWHSEQPPGIMSLGL